MEEKLIVVLHGSPRNEANSWQGFLNMLSVVLKRPRSAFSLAYLEFAEPSIGKAIEEAISDGTKRLIIHPLFLSPGHHVTKDIPKIIEDMKRKYPQVEILYTRPLGIHEKLAEISKERIEEVGIKTGMDIEKKSFEIIEREIDLSKFSREEKEIVKRVIHATAETEFKDTIVFHPMATLKALENLINGKDILVDVEMVAAGISKRYLKGNRVICYISQIEEDSFEGTRAEKSIERALFEEKNLGMVAIGNSPTALLKTIEILKAENRKDLVVIGMPVGFVKAIEAKLLLSYQDFPFITNLSKKGGTSACVATINALLKLSSV